MAFSGKPVRKQYTAAMGESSDKIKQDLSKFEQSIKEMQTCLQSLNETAAEVYGDSLPRAKEFQHALQDENTLVANLARDVHEVEEPLRQYNQQYDDSTESSPAASANRKSEFVTKVLGSLFNAQHVFFSESLMVSEVLMEIVSQTKRVPTAREARLTKEIMERLDGKRVKGQDDQIGFLAGAVKVVSFGPGHRGPGCLVGGAYGSQQPQTKSAAVQIKPASRFSTPPSKQAEPTRVYV